MSNGARPVFDKLTDLTDIGTADLPTLNTPLANALAALAASIASGGDGASAYEVAVANGFVGNEAAWLASLVGAAGADGTDGATGETGETGETGAAGADGASAYEVAVAAGFVGDEAAWLASLVGAAGADGADGGGDLLAANNLSDLENAATAATNLGLGATDAVTHGSLTTTGDITLGGVGSDYTSVNILGNVEPRFYLKTGTNGAKAKVAYQINNSTFSFTNYGGGAFKFFNSASSVLTISNTGDLTASGTVTTGGYTVATLPTPATGMRCYVTDSNRAASTHFGSTVIAAGGGTEYVVPVFYDGTNWIIA